MSAAEIERFNTDVGSDPELGDQMTQHSATLAAVVAFASARGYAFTADEVKEYARPARGGELTDRQLDLVAGGGGVLHTLGQYGPYA
jgi:predicted ribosomally synthesized peptide with nif11-like leader